MPRLAEPELAVAGQVRAGHGEVATEAGFGGDIIELSHGIDGEAERPGDAADLLAEAAQDAAHLALLVAFDDDALGAEAGDGARLDVDGLAGGTGAMDDARDFVAKIDGDRQDIVVAAKSSVGIAQNPAQLRIAQQVLDLA